MIADALDLEEADVLRAINEYTEALLLLDQYDHQVLSKPKGKKPVYRMTYEECVSIVGKMRSSFETDVFGVEKEEGKVAGIIASIYQTAFGEEVYPSIEEKAANLIYFMIKDHPYADGSTVNPVIICMSSTSWATIKFFLIVRSNGSGEPQLSCSVFPNN